MKTEREGNHNLNTIEIANLPLFFIIGRPRSGTTLLKTLFDAHPNVNIPIESPVFMGLYPEFGKINLWDEKTLKRFYRKLIRLPRFDHWRIDHDKLKNELLAASGQNSFETICKIVHINYQSIFDKEEIRIIGDKNPRYSLQTKRLLKAFPNSKIIYIVRDYRDHYVSMKKADFSKSFLTVAIYLWKKSTKEILKLKSKFPKQIYTLRYEDLIHEPEIKIQEICQFLGINYKANVLDFYKKKEGFEQMFSAEFLHRYFEGLLQPINNNSIGQFQNRMTQNEIRIADNIVGNFGSKIGYESVVCDKKIKSVLYKIPRILLIRAYYFYRSLLSVFPRFVRIRMRKSLRSISDFYRIFFKN